MRYVDAGYVAALGAPFLYALVLVWRLRRLERAVAVAATDEHASPVPLDGQP